MRNGPDHGEPADRETEKILADMAEQDEAERRAAAETSGDSDNDILLLMRENELPELEINEGDPTATARELATLIARRDNFLFNGYAPVRIAAEADELPCALEVTVDAVRILAHQLCRPVKVRRSRQKKNGSAAADTNKEAVALSRDIGSLYLNIQGEWGLNAFRGITTAPILKDDGGIRAAEGLDHETGLWCHNIPELVIPASPSEADARAALQSLREFFQTFPYADGARTIDPFLGHEITDFDKPIGLDESTFLVALMTAVCRQSLELAPAVMVRAPTFSGAGTGKGLAVKAMCIIGGGARPSAFTSGHDSEEFDKRLTSALVEARPAVFLDNFNAKELKSDILASVLTEYPAMVRPMGQTKMVPLNTRTFVAITGNAIEIAEDMARRVIVVNFDARMENPEARNFAPGFLDDVFEARPKLLTAALTIWRWGRLTKRKHGKPLGSFERWATWCRDPLLALGCRDPIDRIAEIKAADPRRRMLVTLFETWWAAHGDMLMRATDLADEVISLVPNQHREGPPSRQAVARFLDKHAGTRLGGYAFEQVKIGKDSKPVAHYKLGRVS